MKAKITPENIKGFLQGWFRYSLLDVLPNHIREQIVYRVGLMSEECLINGECPCECSIPAKQMENRSCENNCYGEMLTSEEWESLRGLSMVEETITKGIQRIEEYKLKI